MVLNIESIFKSVSLFDTKEWVILHLDYVYSVNRTTQLLLIIFIKNSSRLQQPTKAMKLREQSQKRRMKTLQKIVGRRIKKMLNNKVRNQYPRTSTTTHTSGETMLKIGTSRLKNTNTKNAARTHPSTIPRLSSSDTGPQTDNLGKLHGCVIVEPLYSQVNELSKSRIDEVVVVAAVEPEPEQPPSLSFSSASGRSSSLSSEISFEHSSMTENKEDPPVGNIIPKTSSGEKMMMAQPHGKCPFLHQVNQHNFRDEIANDTIEVTHDIVQLEKSEATQVQLSQYTDIETPRHTVGCTAHECHGALMEKKGFGLVSDKDSCSKEEKVFEAVAFLKQFAEETGVGQIQSEDRIDKVKSDIMTHGTYIHTFEELQFGCRLAWRNSGRCIMRKVSFSLELRDCRSVVTAKDCFDQIVSHLLYAANGGAIKPVISVFPPKPDGASSPVRIWNSQLVGYAAYQLPNGKVMGDPARLQFTALCVKFGWDPPEEKSDFDILPILISDEETTGLDHPVIFELPKEAILEVEIDHPDYDLFSELNLRWYALPALSSIGVDIGGIMYQTCPFNGWYQITEISRDLLDKQRYDLAEAIAIVCDIPRTTLSVWRDDVQLQLHKAILHSFAAQSVSTVDHHTASEMFLEFYHGEIKKRSKCPADWVWLVPPAGGSMTGVFHQEMFNFILKPQYRLLKELWIEHNIEIPEPVSTFIFDETEENDEDTSYLEKSELFYDKIMIYYGTETGTSLRYATSLAVNIGNDLCSGPFPMNDLPMLLQGEEYQTSAEGDQNNERNKRTLILVLTSTFGKGYPPSTASAFMSRMKKIQHQVSGLDFGVFALGNSAYTDTFVAFGHKTHAALSNVGCRSVMNVLVADELKNQDVSMINH